MAVSVNVSALDMMNSTYNQTVGSNTTQVTFNGSVWTAGGSGSQAGTSASNTNNVYGYHE